MIKEYFFNLITCYTDIGICEVDFPAHFLLPVIIFHVITFLMFIGFIGIRLELLLKKMKGGIKR